MSYPWANNLVYRLSGSELPPANGGARGAASPERSSGNGRRAHGGEPAPQLDALWDRAEHQVAGWQSVTLRMPPSGRGPFPFTIDTGSGGRPRSTGAVNARGHAEVVRWEPFSSYNTGRRARSWLRFLHG